MTIAVACQINTTAFGLMMEVATCGEGRQHRCVWIDALENVAPLLASRAPFGNIVGPQSTIMGDSPQHQIFNCPRS